MTHCTQCGHELAATDRFCGKCGAPRNGHGPRGPNGNGRGSRDAGHRDQRPARAAQPAFVPALQTDQGRKAYAAIVAAKRRRTSKVRLVFLVVAAVLGGLAAFAWKLHADVVAFFAVPAGICLFISLVANFMAWSEKEYYSVPGSRDAAGEHRCIHCGHRGIYRHGQYKSNTKYADCSKCKTNLWQD